jgi:hypothetical protein
VFVFPWQRKEVGEESCLKPHLLEEYVFMFASLLRFRPGFRAGSMVSARRLGTRLLLEELETRTVPSVIVGQTGDTLNITDNDTSGHTISVNQTATQGTFTVQVDSRGASTFLGINNLKVDLSCTALRSL